MASLQKQNVFDSFEYPSPLPPGFHTDEEPSPETGWCTVIIVKILYQVTKKYLHLGKNRGLTLIIDAHSDIISPSSVRDDFEGFLALVNDPLKFPALFEKVEFPGVLDIYKYLVSMYLRYSIDTNHYFTVAINLWSFIVLYIDLDNYLT